MKLFHIIFAYNFMILYYHILICDYNTFLIHPNSSPPKMSLTLMQYLQYINKIGAYMNIMFTFYVLFNQSISYNEQSALFQ